MAIGTIVFLAIIFQLAGFWEHILHGLSLLDIRINAAGYFLISSLLFGLWLIVILVFDRQIHMTFTSGQLKVRTEIGDGEKVYDAVGMTLEKQRSDLFRHWFLGLGSGDLIVRTPEPRRTSSRCRTCCLSAGRCRRSRTCSGRNRSFRSAIVVSGWTKKLQSK